MRITSDIRKATNHWGTVKGPLGEMYMHLTEINWKLGFCSAPERRISVWSHIDEQGRGDIQCGLVDIQRSMDQRRVALLWAEAAKRRHGEGMEEGVDVTVIGKHFCTVIKGKAMGRAGALMAIDAGALWPPARIQESIKRQEEHDTKYKRCGCLKCDEAHLFWVCPPINELPKRSIRRTNGKYFDLNMAIIGQGTPFYFLRGLMPRTWTQPATQLEYFRENLGRM